MAVLGPVQSALDSANRRQHTGLALMAVGWALLVFDSIPAVWIWTGWRSGGMFWFWYVMGLGIVGTTLVIAGSLVRSRAAKQVARVEEDARQQRWNEEQKRAA